MKWAKISSNFRICFGNSLKCIKISRYKGLYNLKLNSINTFIDSFQMLIRKTLSHVIWTMISRTRLSVIFWLQIPFWSKSFSWVERTNKSLNWILVTFLYILSIFLIIIHAIHAIVCSLICKQFFCSFCYYLWFIPNAIKMFWRIINISNIHTFQLSFW